MSEKIKFEGTGVAMVTPFSNDGSVDYPAMEILIDELISQGIDYLVALGTTAETPTLSRKEKREILEVVKNTVAGKIPIIAGAGGNCTSDVIDWIREIGTTGYDAYLSVAPYYSKPTQTGMIQHFSAIASYADLPVMLYNVPGRTSSNLNAETVLELAHELGEKIVGIKEASGNFQQIMDIQQNKPDHFLVISGDDALTLPMLGLGCGGVISVIGNALPGLFSSMVNDALNGDFVSARKKHYEVLPLITAIFKEGNPGGVKALLEIRGFGSNNLRLPLVTATSALYEELQKLNSAIG